ncbi:MAG TPA: (2Fe-2S)-binding protein [Candidatus Bathyarchaeia archaeon]|nr:(2Fe-2S)-binding protein [Candidatus Bathyarchaeia archaeon]
MTKDTITLQVNGSKFIVEVGPYELLSKVLRDDLDLTGTKRGCDFGGCGACTVLLDGKAVYSCMMPARHAEGHEITTVEGLADEGKLTPVQEAFVRNTAFQCGYCTPGIIMASTALLNQKPNPTEEDIREGLAGNLCRCTGYVSIFKAIMEAAQAKSSA